ncbi:hypothetical protein RF11_07609 [Thelohanellus kitauei]|uniref:Uncharacterized protein n=1 Tax=Thelohanellus kitauei TaxID=669202 RepID=A0A0C2MK11_THEKT|nr:hypothetical protein RF11_07609 [Thelohanellus kitauei]
MDTNNSINVDLCNFEINDTKSNRKSYFTSEIFTFNGTIYFRKLEKTHNNINSNFSVYSSINAIELSSGGRTLQISDIHAEVKILEEKKSVTDTSMIHTPLPPITKSSSKEYSETWKPLSDSTTLNSIEITNSTIKPSRTSTFQRNESIETSTQISRTPTFTSSENGESTAQILNMSTVQTDETTGSSTQVSKKSRFNQVQPQKPQQKSETTASSKRTSRGTTVKMIEGTEASTQTSRSTMIKPTETKETSTQTSTTPNVQPTGRQKSSTPPSTSRRISPQTSVRTESTNKPSTIPLTTTSFNRKVSTQKPTNSTPVPREMKEFSKGGNAAKIVLCVVIVCFFIGFVVTLAYKNGLIQSKLQNLADRINREIERM